MATIDQKSQAEQDAIAPALTNEVIDCTTCGRNCKHVPATAGGGTAGGVKGEKWTETSRSQLRCPSCGGKMHRKEGRVQQQITCAWLQACRATGLTVAAKPTEAVAFKLAEMLGRGEILDPPTEREVVRLILIHDGADPAELDAKKPRERKVSTKVVQDKDKAPVEGTFVEADPISLAEIPGLTETENKLKTKKEKPAKEPKAKKPRKAKKVVGDEGDAPEAPVAEPLVTAEEVEIDPEVAGDDDYNPLAGVGMAFDTDDDDDEDELTPAQKQALGVS